MTDIAITPALERIARVIRAYDLSPNGGGEAAPEEVVSAEVASRLIDTLPLAAAVLRTLREPTHAMVAAGAAAGNDPAEIWVAMVRAAIEGK